ncbi:MAG: hypothetical protein M3Y37_03300 [Chloroflexota bacterium]|jgi:hypothetical protein|nr:hypothetical protein [Chloroflexota bacterium]
MNRFDLIAQSVRITAVENAMAHAAESIRLRRASQHRFQEGSKGQSSPMARARSGS